MAVWVCVQYTLIQKHAHTHLHSLSGLNAGTVPEHNYCQICNSVRRKVCNGRDNAAFSCPSLSSLSLTLLLLLLLLSPCLVLVSCSIINAIALTPLRDRNHFPNALHCSWQSANVFATNSPWWTWKMSYKFFEIQAEKLSGISRDFFRVFDFRQSKRSCLGNNISIVL